MSPSGIIMQSGSIGATQEDIEKVLTANGYEADKPAPAAVEEPVRESFKSDEEFEQAKEEFIAKQDEKAEAEAEAEPSSSQRKPSRKQRAIDKATKQLQQDLRSANERLATLEGKNKPAPAPQLVAPKRDDFKSDEEFDEAKFQFRYKVQRLKDETEAAHNAVNERLKENFESYQAQVKDFKEEHDDWDEVVNQPIPLHNGVFLAIQEQENGAAVTYYLGTHPEEARRLAELSELKAIMEVGRLSERLKTGAPNRGEADGTAKTKTKPKLPEPVKPVSTAATSSTLSSRDAAQARDFKAFKRAQARGQ